jgi:hypothetical protein
MIQSIPNRILTAGRMARVWIAVLVACGALPWCDMHFCNAQVQTQELLSSEVLSTTRVSLPKAGAPRSGGGFNATIDISNLFGVGYVGVRVRLNSTLGPLSATRRFVIRLAPVDRHLPSERSIAAELPLTFDQGQSQVSLERAFPKWTVGNSFLIEITEDGVTLPDYVAQIGNAFPGYVSQSPTTVMPSEAINHVLFVDTKPIHRSISQRQAVIPANPLDAWTSGPLESLPTDWRLLRDVNCIVIDRDQIAAAYADKPTPTSDALRARVDAIRDWMMMGGTLVVLRAPDANELVELLNVSPVQTSSDVAALEGVVEFVASQAIQEADRLTSWVLSVEGDQAQGRIEMSGSSLRDQSSTGVFPMVAEATALARQKNAAIAQARQMLAETNSDVEAFRSSWSNGSVHNVSAGLVIGLPGESIDDLYSFEVLRQLIGYKTSPMLQRGVDPLMGDTRSRGWLIPGVAEPPVYTFMGILTLFVLLVGPVAYRWTTLGHRSHLMFLIAPALALITTAAMFTYSIVSDGFSTTVRVRQLTWIDGENGSAVERTRTTLFSGISPREGVQFAPDAEVMFYPSGGTKSWDELSSDVREVRMRARIDDTEQRFDSSVLPSRTQTQFVSHRVRHQLGSVALEGIEPLDPNGLASVTESVKLTSTLDFELLQMVARSQDGRYWSVDRLGNGQTVSAKWLQDDASKLLGQLYIQHNLVGAVSKSNNRGRDQKVRDLILFTNLQINPNGKIVKDGTFESWLNRNLFIKGDLPPGMFVAIGSPSADVIPVGQAEQVGSVRYVWGTLK